MFEFPPGRDGTPVRGGVGAAAILPRGVSSPEATAQIPGAAPTRRRRCRWTPQFLAEIDALRDAGLQTRDIAARYGLKPASLVQLVSRNKRWLGMRARPPGRRVFWTPRRVALAEAALRLKPLADVAEAFGVKPDALRMALRRAKGLST